MKIIAILLLLAAGIVHAEEKTFGAAPKLTGKPVALSSAIQSAEMNKPLKLSGKVTTVCQNKGCWMQLVDGKESARVTFKDYGFFVPKNLLNQEVVVEGVLSVKSIPVSEARHYAKDAGKSEEEISAIKEDQKEYSIVAESVIVP